ncbi:MAG: hypothetical protein CM1200mP27_11020 [Chloroflexota bacterium]|nr:MAG: hypothetical protein CM1200mP27_11020 [Chloroflexota bacterium]
MGMVTEILPTFSRKPLFGYPFIVFSGIVIGIMGWAVWSHHMFTVGLGPVANSVFTITTMLIAVPTGVKIFNWIGTLWKGSIEFTTAMMFALAFIALFIVGGLSGVSHAVSPSDFQQQDTYYIVAHIHYVLFGGSIVAIFAGTYYWFPKITGKMLDETLGKLNFWLIFIGMNLTFFPMHFVGLNGMPRRIYTYSSEFGWEHMNQLASIGYIVMALGFLVFMYNLWQTRNSRRVSHDPWDAPGVEWTISSPPPPYNFAEIPQILGRDHYWIVKENAEAAGTPITGPEAPVDPSSIHMPSPSYWPLFTAIGVALIGGGLLSHYALSFVGGIITMVGTIAWANEPPSAPSDHH